MADRSWVVMPILISQSKGQLYIWSLQKQGQEFFKREVFFMKTKTAWEQLMEVPCCQLEFPHGWDQPGRGKSRVGTFVYAGSFQELVAKVLRVPVADVDLVNGDRFELWIGQLRFAGPTLNEILYRAARSIPFE